MRGKPVFTWKETYQVYFQAHNFKLILKVVVNTTSHQFPHTVPCCRTVFLLCMNCSVLANVPLRPRIQSLLIGQFIHVWPSMANNNRAALLNQFLRAELAARQWSDIVWCHKVMELKERVLMRRFMSSVFCRASAHGSRALPTELCGAPTQTFLTFEIFYTQKELYETLTKRGKKSKLTVHTFSHLHTHTFITYSGCRPRFPSRNHL